MSKLKDLYCFFGGMSGLLSFHYYMTRKNDHRSGEISLWGQVLKS